MISALSAPAAALTRSPAALALSTRKAKSRVSGIRAEGEKAGRVFTDFFFGSGIASRVISKP